MCSEGPYKDPKGCLLSNIRKHPDMIITIEPSKKENILCSRVAITSLYMFGKINSSSANALFRS